ncbi:MAG: hypothetical protein AVDCRST_MAG93-4127, partial [uncultured Chloroflexia bacterium]
APCDNRRRWYRSAASRRRDAGAGAADGRRACRAVDMGGRAARGLRRGTSCRGRDPSTGFRRRAPAGSVRNGTNPNGGPGL